MKSPKKNFDRSLLPRVSRPDEALNSEGEGQIWAVSYSDLLMVLMSFFILFFSFENPEQAHRGLAQVALAFKGEASSTNGSGTSSQLNLDQKLRSSFLGPQVEIESEGDTLSIHFLENAFASGEFRLSSKLKEDLRQFAKLLEPFKGEIELQLIGHADKRPLAPRDPYLQDNFDLSALRALAALKYLGGQGFPTERLSAQGSASNERESRSLSVRIRMSRREDS